MRILMIYPNRNRYLCPAPIGALLVSERLASDGHEVRFLDLMHSKKPRESLAAAIDEHMPDLVCFSIRNVDNQSMDKPDHPIQDAAELTALARERSDAPILIGGTAVTTFPAQIMAKLGADYAMAGDDVDPVSRFVASLERGAPDLAVPGLHTNRGGCTVSNSPSVCGYGSVRFTGHGRIDLKSYERKGFYACGVVTHSGCPHGCSFCDAHRTFGREYRLRDPRAVVNELTELRKIHGARSIWLVNSGINRPLEYGKELCARIIEAKLGITFSCIIEPGEMDREMAQLLRRAGVSSAMIFGSTMSDEVLERNQPFYRSRDVVEAAKLFAEEKVDYFLGQMFGAPGETLEGIRDSLELGYRLKPAMLISGFGFRIQPDTPLREIAVREGVISGDDDCFKASYYLSPGLARETVDTVMKKFRLRHPWQYARVASFVVRSIAGTIIGTARG